MLRYLLDAHIVIHVIKRRPPQAQARFNQHHGEMAISSITLAELVHGAEKSSDATRNLRVVADFRSRLAVLDYGEVAAYHCGAIRAALERADTPIGVNDLHIAAQTRAGGLVLVSNNLVEFSRVPALLTDNWVYRRAPSHASAVTRSGSCAPPSTSPAAASCRACRWAGAASRR